MVLGRTKEEGGGRKTTKRTVDDQDFLYVSSVSTVPKITTFMLAGLGETILIPMTFEFAGLTIGSID